MPLETWLKLAHIVLCAALCIWGLFGAIYIYRRRRRR